MLIRVLMCDNKQSLVKWYLLEWVSPVHVRKRSLYIYIDAFMHAVQTQGRREVQYFKYTDYVVLTVSAPL